MSDINDSIPRFLVILNIIATTFMLMCLVLQSRLVSLGSNYICATIFVYPFTVLLLDIIAEIYGYKNARQTLWLVLLSTFIFSLIVTFFTKLPGPIFWHPYLNAFNVAMHPLIRTAFVGFLSILIGQFINIYIISKLKILVKGRFFVLRCIGSSVIGDTVTFVISLFGFFVNKMDLHEIAIITLIELALMYMFAVLLAFPGSIIVRLLKKSEPVHVFNNTIDFNPFSLKTN